MEVTLSQQDLANLVKDVADRVLPRVMEQLALDQVWPSITNRAKNLMDIFVTQHNLEFEGTKILEDYMKRDQNKILNAVIQQVARDLIKDPNVGLELRKGIVKAAEDEARRLRNLLLDSED